LGGTTTGRHSAELRQLAVELHNHTKSYMQASNPRAWWQIISTAVPFVVLLAAMVWLAGSHYWASLLLAIPAGGLLIRFFALQHDCGHGSLFAEKSTNEIVGQFISLLTFTPYDHWRRSHALHHAGSGNLDRRGFGDVETITIREYEAMSTAEKWRYRLTRHPIASLIIGPPLYFFVLQRFALLSNVKKKDCLPAIMAHNAALIAFYGGLMWAFGWGLVLSIVLPVVLIAAWIGGWLFFVQHQFEETLWDGADEWDVKIAALLGSSHLQLPAILNWMSCDIGLHHIHHLSSRIPNYRLRECMATNKKLEEIAPKLSVWTAMKSMHLALWDEETRRLISFGEYNKRVAAKAETAAGQNMPEQMLQPSE
jgi:acyl-lipid omega-6 desaturase (Delta-12 desaturase)